MSEETRQCQAITRAGKRCKLPPRPGSDYCHIHQTESVAAAAPPAPEAPAPAPAGQSQFRELVAELNALADELQARVPTFNPPPFTPEGLLRLLRDNIDRMTPDMRLGLLRDLQANLQGTSPRDFFDPDTWKGLWFLLNYTLQTEASALKDTLATQLSRLPGAGAVANLGGMLQGSSPRDFLEIDTWKGVWFLLNYTLQAQVADVKRRVLGDNEPNG